jgi:dimethylargininase
MNSYYGAQSMIAPMQTVLVRRPDEAFGKADPARWHYTAPIDLPAAQAEHEAFVGILLQKGVEVAYHASPLPDHADAIFVHDPVIVCDQGGVILQMGKDLRRGEEDAIARTLEGMGVPIHYRLHDNALAEGGDLLWVDEHTLAVGQGFRTNAEGLRQLQEALPKVEVIPVHLPYADGPEACLHLMSFISIVGEKLAVVYLPHMPVPFYQFLQGRGFHFVEVPEEEYATMGPNVLALSPSVCVMLEGNPITKARLEAAGCTVYTYKGNEISLKAEGGATCLTRPVLRDVTNPAYTPTQAYPAP